MWVEEKKIKKEEKSDTARDVTEDNPLPPLIRGIYTMSSTFIIDSLGTKALEKYSALRHGYSNLCL